MPQPPMHPTPFTEATWAAYDAAAEAELVVTPEQMHAVLSAAVAKLLDILAQDNEIVTETRWDYANTVGGVTVQRPLYPVDLRRLSKQTRDTPPVGPRPPGTW